MRNHIVVCIFLAFLKISRTAPLNGKEECSQKVADVIFALDTSGSIWEEDFQQQLTFVTNVVNQFGIGQDKVRVGLLTFGSKVHHQCHLKDFYDKDKLITAILNMKYVGGGTNTGSAIAHARNVMFKSSYGGRDNAVKILIVITDGFSRNTTQAALEASICRSIGIKLFSIGVGFGVDTFELTAIANRPNEDDEKFSFRVDDFQGLETIRSAIVANVCKAMSLAEKQNDDPGYTHQVEKEIRQYCGGKPADIYFMVDASSSIMEHNFRKILNFIKDVIDLFEIGPDRTRTGVVLFSDGINPLIRLNNTFTRSELKRKITDAPYLEGGTRTGSTLQYIRKRGFSREQARRHVAHIAIILTDGQSEDMQETMREAKLAHKQGIYLFVIGIGDQIDRQELRAIASDPVEDFMFEIDHFDALSSLKSILAIETCSAQAFQQDENRCSLRKLDIIYVFDSFTLGQKKTNTIKDFISDVIELTAKDKDDSIHSGVLVQSCSHHHDIPITSNENANDIVSRTSICQSKGLSALLRKLRHHGFRTENGGRYEAQNVAVIFVDGHLSDYHEIQMEAKRAKFRNRIDIFVIAVGGKEFDSSLETVCSEPLSEHLFTVTNYAALSAIKPLLVSKFCKIT